MAQHSVDCITNIDSHVRKHFISKLVSNSKRSILEYGDKLQLIPKRLDSIQQVPESEKS